MKKCKWYLCNNITTTWRQNFCSRKCGNKAGVTKKRRALKEKAVQYLGGKCVRCGYAKCNRSLDFHHTDPSKKDFGIGSGSVKGWKTVEKELDKCTLLCKNCHGEEHEKEYTQRVGDSLTEITKPVKQRKKCQSCDDLLAYHSKPNALRCRECYLKYNRNINLSKEEVIIMVKDTNINRTAKKLGVSFGVIKKFILS